MLLFALTVKVHIDGICAARLVRSQGDSVRTGLKVSCSLLRCRLHTQVRRMAEGLQRHSGKDVW